MKVKFFSKIVESDFPAKQKVKTGMKRSQVFNTKRITTCIVTIDNVEYSGTVAQYFKDPDNKKVAQANAFRKAVLEIPDRTIRKKLWESYRK